MAAEDMAPTILGVIISVLALGGLFIALRVYTRTFLKKGAFGWDDTLIIITWFIILGYNICMFISVSHGYGKHSTTLSMYQYGQVVHAEVIGQAFAIASFPTGKASVAVCLMRIFPGKKLRWILWFIVAMNAIAFYLDAILILVQCNPVRKQWDRTAPGYCWDPSVIANYGIYTGAVGCAADFALAGIPWFYIAKLNINRREKVAIGVAMSVGFLAGIFSILKIIYTTRLTSRADYAYDTIPLVLWSCGELCAINIAACIPTLRPLLQRLTKRGPYSSASRSRGTGPQAYPFKTYGSNFDYPQRDAFASTGACTGASDRSRVTDDEQILVESSIEVESGVAKPGACGVSEREATERF